MADVTRGAFFDRARERLRELWSKTEVQPRSEITIGANLWSIITRSINATTLSYRYVLVTHLLGKELDDRLHARACQASSPLEGAWDARSLCHKVIVEFDRENHSVLGGSSSPYLSKPLREHSIDLVFLASKKNKEEYKDLVFVLEHAQQNPSEVAGLLRAVLWEIRQRLAEVSIRYPVPNRASFDACVNVMSDYLADRTGGVRLQAASVALLATLGEHLSLFDSVRTSNINAADSQTGHVADLECIDKNGNVVLAVEVKDRELRLVDVQDKLPSIREHAVKESLFLISGDVNDAERELVSTLFKQEFASGQNLYVADFHLFLRVCLILLGETGRRVFLKQVGDTLDASHLALVHRQRWRDLMAAI